MRIFEVGHEGTLQVEWKSRYEHHDRQTLAAVQAGQMIAVMNGNEFQRFKKVLL